MKHAALQIKLLCLTTALLLCLPLLAACTGDQESEGATTGQTTAAEPNTDAPTEQPTEEPAESTDESTAPDTPPTTEDTTHAETESESQTETETEPEPEPELLTSLSFSMLPADIKLSDYLFQAHQCKASLEQDEQDGQL
ncbi:MAG: hypothetical protein IIU63_05570, partial [Clostridia bacterium]|nr:hypothetical protein [Clostridia bacterium]